MSLKRSQQKPLRLGTRGSKLARWQAEWVAGELRRFGQDVELVEIATQGDIERFVSIEEIGTRGVFTKEIQRSLLLDEVDVAVHSLKDLPTEPVAGLILAAIPLRASVADAVVLAQNSESEVLSGSGKLEALPEAARIGTGSLRRRAQLLHRRPDLRVSDVRGNVDTRLQKLERGEFDALVLAEAGMKRLGLEHRIAFTLAPEEMHPAVGQGALGLECRERDVQTREALASLDDRDSKAAVVAERAMLQDLRGGCMAPVGAWGRMEAGKLHLSAVVLSADGAQRLFAADSSAISDAANLGRKVAAALIAQGADDLIASVRNS